MDETTIQKCDMAGPARWYLALRMGEGLIMAESTARARGYTYRTKREAAEALASIAYVDRMHARTEESEREAARWRAACDARELARKPTREDAIQDSHERACLSRVAPLGGED